MPRSRLTFALLLALPLAACSKDKPPVPGPDKPQAAQDAPGTPVKVLLPPVSASPLKAAAPKPAITVDAPAAGTVQPVGTAVPLELVKTADPKAKEEPKSKDEAAEAPAKAKAPPDAPAAKAGATGATGVPMPATKSGVLGAGAADKILKVGSPPIVTMLDAGGEPRSDLGYALTKGNTQKLSMGMDMTMAMKMGPKALPPTTIPHMVVLLDMNTADQNGAGEWKIDSKLTSLSIEAKGAADKPVADALRPQLDSLKGLGIGYWVNTRGQVRDTKIDVPASLPGAAQQMIQGMNQSFEAMVVPLPKDAVGTGARWQVVSRLASSGADMLQWATYTLRSRAGSKATIEVNLTQLAASDTIKVPGAPPGTAAMVKDFHSGGSGMQQLDTKVIAPEGGAMQIKTSMTIGVKDGSLDQETSIDTVTAVQMKRP
ncbi:MAG: hypothetical protein U0359_31795 [Byssovorax sp.]